MDKKIRRMRASTLVFLKFLYENFGRGKKSFRFEDVVRAGWKGRRWNLFRLCEEGNYLRHSRRGKEYYTYARGVSNGAKHGQVVRRTKHEKIGEDMVNTMLPERAEDRMTPELAGYMNRLLAKHADYEGEIEGLKQKDAKIIEMIRAINDLAKIDELLKS